MSLKLHLGKDFKGKNLHTKFIRVTESITNSDSFGFTNVLEGFLRTFFDFEALASKTSLKISHLDLETVLDADCSLLTVLRQQNTC